MLFTQIIHVNLALTRNDWMITLTSNVTCTYISFEEKNSIRNAMMEKHVYPLNYRSLDESSVLLSSSLSDHYRSSFLLPSRHIMHNQVLQSLMIFINFYNVAKKRRTEWNLIIQCKPVLYIIFVGMCCHNGKR